MSDELATLVAYIPALPSTKPKCTLLEPPCSTVSSDNKFDDVPTDTLPNEPVEVAEPLIVFPRKVCVSSALSPNIVEPLND